MIVSTSSAARADSAVAFCCNDSYAPFAAFAAAQIATLNPDRRFDLVLCRRARLTLPDSLAALQIRQVQLDAAALDAFPAQGRHGAMAFMRLLLPEALSGEYRRILYLDADIFLRGADLHDLLERDLGTHPVAAVRDNTQWRTPGRMPHDFRQFGLGHAAYLNSGVLVIDCAGWQNAALTQRCRDFAAQTEGPLRYNDQTVLNCVLHGDWLELSPVWNWQYTRPGRLYEAMVSANIVHFIGPVKPWRDVAGDLPPAFTAPLRRFMATHYPDVTLPPPPPAPAHRGGLMAKLTLRHVLSGWKMHRYLARFPDQPTTS